MTDDPYRSSGVGVAVAPPAIKPNSKGAMAARLAGWTAAVVAASVLAPPGIGGIVVWSLIIGASVCEATVARSWRERGLRALTRLPFGVLHVPGNKRAPLPRARRIEKLTINLETALSAPAMERVVRGAQLVCRTLVATTEPESGRLDQVIVLTGWPNQSDDIALLVNLLTTWGRELHSAHGVRIARVEWRPSGPPPPSL